MALNARNISGGNTNHGSTGVDIPNLGTNGSKIDIFAQEVGTGAEEKIIKYLVFFLKNTGSTGSQDIDIASISISQANNFYLLDGIGDSPSPGDSAISLRSHLGGTNTLIPGDNATSGNRGFILCTSKQNGYEFGVDDGSPESTRIEYIDGVDAILQNGVPQGKYRTFIVTCEPTKNITSAETATLTITPVIGTSITVNLSLESAGSKNQFAAYFDESVPDGIQGVTETGLYDITFFGTSAEFANHIPGLTNPVTQIDLATQTGNSFKYDNDYYVGQRQPDVYVMLTVNPGAPGGQLSFNASTQIQILDKNGAIDNAPKFALASVFTDKTNLPGTNLSLSGEPEYSFSGADKIWLAFQHVLPEEYLQSYSSDKSTIALITYNQNPSHDLLDHDTGNPINTAQGAIKLEDNLVQPYGDGLDLSDVNISCFFVQGTRGPSVGWTSSNVNQPHLTGDTVNEGSDYDGGVLWQTNNLQSGTASGSLPINLTEESALVGIETGKILSSDVLFQTQQGEGPRDYDVNISGNITNNDVLTSNTTKSITFGFTVRNESNVINTDESTEGYGESLKQSIASGTCKIKVPNISEGLAEYNKVNVKTYYNTITSQPTRYNPNSINIDSTQDFAAISTDIKLPTADCVKPLPAELIIWSSDGKIVQNHRGHINDDNTRRASIDLDVSNPLGSTGWIGNIADEGVTSSDDASTGKAVHSTNWRSSLNGSVIEQQSKRARYSNLNNSLLEFDSSSKVVSYSQKVLNEFGHDLDKGTSVVADSSSNIQKIILNGCLSWSAINTSTGAHSDANADANDEHYFHVATIDTPKTAGNPYRMRVYNNVNSQGYFIKNPDEASNDHVYAHMKTLWMYNIGSLNLRITGASLTEWGKKVGGAETGTWAPINPDLSNNEEFEHDSSNDICSPIKVWIPQFSTSNAPLASSGSHAGDQQIILVDDVYTSRESKTSKDPAVLNATHEFTQRFRKTSIYNDSNKPYIMQPYKNGGAFNKGDKPFSTIPIQVFADATNFEETSTSNEDGAMPNQLMYRVKLTVKYVHQGSNTTNDLNIYDALSVDGTAGGTLKAGITEEEVSLWLTMQLQSTAGTLSIVDEDDDAITDNTTINLGDITIG